MACSWRAPPLHRHRQPMPLTSKSYVTGYARLPSLFLAGEDQTGSSRASRPTRRLTARSPTTWKRAPRRSHSISSTHWNRPTPTSVAIPARVRLAMRMNCTFLVCALGRCLPTPTSSSMSNGQITSVSGVCCMASATFPYECKTRRPSPDAPARRSRSQ
ncbi:hypothetical protein ebA295 [Aromatoleum aromaticum EbN1]|uniref:Uncharacterized protein n=1 Tax=Aromatoleum aromaticum (strain DSM 19018 / LMG 30748 / EbN1) TaxID=76114 RepID=Q5P8T5_AROAE|nr:hypothetical protein ebA295 [Aromatoleum aromaticum EbN1]